MWFDFSISIIIVVAILYIPGYFFFRFIKTDRQISIIIAPIISILAYSILGIVYSKANIFASQYTIFIPVALISLGLFILGKLKKKDLTSGSFCWTESNKLYNSSRSTSSLIIYIVFGIFAGLFIFVCSLYSLDSTTQTYDNVFHYNLIQSFINSGNWSSLNTSLYLDESSQSAAFNDSSYYPSAWHILVALTSLIGGVSIPIASNAVNFVFTSIVFPLAVFLLLSTLFHNKQLILLGSILCVSFTAFPWGLIEYWPLFPNTASLCILPIFLSSFIVLLGDSNESHKHDRIVAGLTLILSIISYVFIQPNSIFSGAVFLAPFLVAKGSLLLSERIKLPEKKLNIRLIIGGILTLFIIAIWIALYKLPQLSAVTSYKWSPISGKLEAFLDALSITFTNIEPQLLLAALVIIGSIILLLKKTDKTWLIISYALACLIYVLSASFEAGSTIKHVFSGFWYTDPYRVAGFCALFAIPLATVGLYSVLSFIKSTLVKHKKTHLVRACSIATVFVFAIITFLPNFTFGNKIITSPFGIIKDSEYAITNESDLNYYDKEEEEFVNNVIDLTGNESIIINQPYDGSLFSYAENNINVYYRSISGYSEEIETENSMLIRMHLCDIATNEEVQKAVREVGAQYVLLLESNTIDSEMMFPTYNKNDWIGINQINDETPGLSLILNNGRMKLYKIIE